MATCMRQSQLTELNRITFEILFCFCLVAMDVNVDYVVALFADDKCATIEKKHAISMLCDLVKLHFNRST